MNAYTLDSVECWLEDKKCTIKGNAFEYDYTGSSMLIVGKKVRTKMYELEGNNGVTNLTNNGQGTRHIEVRMDNNRQLKNS